MTDQSESAVTLNHGETTILYELISELCERTSDGGSIPPQAWRTAANKMQAARLAFDDDDRCPYCCDPKLTGPDEFCCGMQEDDYWRRQQQAAFDDTEAT